MPRYLVAEVLPNGGWIIPVIVTAINHDGAATARKWKPGSRLAVWRLGEHPETYHVGTDGEQLTIGARL